MGYYVKPQSWKRSAPKWKVQFVSYKDGRRDKPKVRKPKREWDVPAKRWHALGFNEFMTLNEAKARAAQLNAQRHIRLQEIRIRKLEVEKKRAKSRYDAFLPSEFVAEFENKFLRKRDSQMERGLKRTSRAFVVWNAAQRMIVAVAVDPSEWFYHTHEIYDYFFEQKMSLRYLASSRSQTCGAFISQESFADLSSRFHSRKGMNANVYSMRIMKRQEELSALQNPSHQMI